MAEPDTGPGRSTRARVTRRGLLIAGGATLGLVVAWEFWPSGYQSDLAPAAGEHMLSAWVKIGRDGQVIVALPQSEMGQGVATVLPQILAGELGADWRTVGVQPAPPNPLFANELLARQWADAALPEAAATGGGLAKAAMAELARRNSFVVTADSTSVRGYEQRLREAGATARAMLCQAAARRWSVPVAQCDTREGFVVAGNRRLPFGALAELAAAESPPDPPVLRQSPTNALSGRDVPRLDAPSKVDGGMVYAADVRLPDMLFAAVRHAPLGGATLGGFDAGAAARVPGFVGMVKGDSWLAATANSGWAAEQALAAAAPRFTGGGPAVDSSAIAKGLEAAFNAPPADPVFATGNVAAALKPEAGTRVFDMEFRTGAGVFAPLETRSATARVSSRRAELWVASQAPESARDQVAEALGLSTDSVVLYPMPAGGSFGRNLDNGIAAVAALIAREAGRPVQLTRSRLEDLAAGPFRPPALGRLTGALDAAGNLVAWRALIATPSAVRELNRRLVYGDSAADARQGVAGAVDPLAIEGAVPPYAIPNLAVTHLPASLPLPVGRWRGGGHTLSAFMTESLIDQLAVAAGKEPLSWRIGMLGGNPRLARVLQGVAAMAGWDGGQGPGSGGRGMGLACHSLRGSHIAVIATTAAGQSGVTVKSLAAMVDCGRVIHPDIVRQQIEGGLIFGLADALGAVTGFAGGRPTAAGLADLALPRLADAPDISVELVASDEPPGGVGEIGAVPVAAAVANALRAASGTRLTTLPLLAGGE